MRTRVPILATVGLAASAAVLAATPSFAGTATARTATCAPTDPSGGTVNLTVADNGRSICLLRNQHLSVSLLASPALPPTEWWMPIERSGTALAALPTPPPDNGVTYGNFRAAKPGRSGLRSVWNPCPPPTPTQPRCTRPVRSWHVIVTVSTARQP